MCVFGVQSGDLPPSCSAGGPGSAARPCACGRSERGCWVHSPFPGWPAQTCCRRSRRRSLRVLEAALPSEGTWKRRSWRCRRCKPPSCAGEGTSPSRPGEGQATWHSVAAPVRLWLSRFHLGFLSPAEGFRVDGHVWFVGVFSFLFFLPSEPRGVRP